MRRGESKACLFILSSAFCSVLSFTACSLHVSEPQVANAESESKIRELLRLGTEALRKNDPQSLQQSEAYFELALELRENDPRALDGLGSIAFRSNNLERAEWFFRRAAKADSRYDRAYEHLASVAERRGEHENAENLLRTAVRLNPLNYRARNNLALLAHDSETETPESRVLARTQFLKAEGIFQKSSAPVQDMRSAVFENFSRMRDDDEAKETE